MAAHAQRLDRFPDRSGLGQKGLPARDTVGRRSIAAQSRRDWRIHARDAAAEVVER